MLIKFIFLIIIFLYLLTILNYKKKNTQIFTQKNKIIQENFFIIDSHNLEKTQSKMYGYSVSKKGILTDNYYKNLGYYEEPEPLGTYIMIRKNDEEIRINQDYNGGFGLYIYENKTSGFFCF